MSRAPKTTTTTTTTGTALTDWREELEKEAAAAAAMEASAGGGQFFSTRSGILALNDVPMPDNQMAVVILDSILENKFYEASFDSDNPAPPTCFAFGRDEAEMAPHPTVVERGQAQNDSCRGCPMNEWGSADKGRGKACGNRRRLALVSAGELLPSGQLRTEYSAEQIETSPLAFLTIPVTSVKGYANYVKQISNALKRPPFGVVTLVRVIPDAKTQFKVTFSPIKNVGDELLGLVVQRRRECVPLLEQPYNLDVEERPAKAAPARGAKVQVRPPVKKGKY